MFNKRFSWVGCHENDVIAPVDEDCMPPATPVTPGRTALSKKDGSTSSLPTIVGWISYKPMDVLSRVSVPNRLFLKEDKSYDNSIEVKSSQQSSHINLPCRAPGNLGDRFVLRQGEHRFFKITSVPNINLAFNKRCKAMISLWINC